MKPFLQSIARTYLHHESDTLVDTCFVFPNRRSTVYFTDYMRAEAQKECRRIILPETTTIVDFTESFSQSSMAADRMEMVFILFGVYRDVVGAGAGAEAASSIDFNRFIQWADVLLNDFDDVDHALADPEQIFSNVERLKEISSNYLTAEQIEVLGHYFDTTNLRADVERFWNHIGPHDSEGNHKASQGFLRIWQVLGEVYRNFIERLKQSGLHSPVLSALSLILAGGIRMLAAFLTHFPLLLTNGAGYYGGFLLRYLSDRQAFSPDPEKVSDGQFLLAMLLGEILFLIAAFLGEKYGCIREGRIRQKKMSKGQKL